MEDTAATEMCVMLCGQLVVKEVEGGGMRIERS